MAEDEQPHQEEYTGAPTTMDPLYNGAAVFSELYLPKIAAVFSMIGSAIVLLEVIKDIRSKKGASMVSRILLSMCVGDILFSL